MQPKHLERIDLPAIIEAKQMFTVNYGCSRGWRAFHTREQAEKELREHLQYRIDSLTRELFEFTKARRKLDQ